MTSRPCPPGPRRDSPAPGRLARSAALAVLLAAGACAGPAGGTRVEDLPRAPAAEPGYHIAPGDVLGIRVWNQESMSISRARVREDGRISVPFLQDVAVVGETPNALSRRLEESLKSYVMNPVVTVTVEEVRPLRVSIIGQVSRPGVYDLERGAGVLAALAAAGGLNDFAHRDRVYVLRPLDGPERPAPLRIRFTFQALTSAEPAATGFSLRQGDTVVVE